MINPIVEGALDAQLAKMLGQKIPNYELLRARVPGIDQVMMAPPEKNVQFWWTDHHLDVWIEHVTTAGTLRELLEKSTYDERYPGWLFVPPWEEDEHGSCYQGIYDGGSDQYRVNLLEIDYQI